MSEPRGGRVGLHLAQSQSFCSLSPGLSGYGAGTREEKNWGVIRKIQGSRGIGPYRHCTPVAPSFLLTGVVLSYPTAD